MRIRNWTLTIIVVSSKLRYANILYIGTKLQKYAIGGVSFQVDFIFVAPPFVHYEKHCYVM